MWTWKHIRISLSRFLAECRKMRLNQGGSVSCIVCLFWVVLVDVFSCTALFVNISQMISREDHLRNDHLDCGGWAVDSTPTPWLIVVSEQRSGTDGIHGQRPMETGTERQQSARHAWRGRHFVCGADKDSLVWKIQLHYPTQL